MSKARKIIHLVEQGAGVKVVPDLDKILDGWVTHIDSNYISYECPNFPNGRLQVFDFGSWQWLENGVVVNSGDTYQSLSKFLRDKFGLSLVKAEPVKKEIKNKKESLKAIKEQYEDGWKKQAQEKARYAIDYGKRKGYTSIVQSGLEVLKMIQDGLDQGDILRSNAYVTITRVWGK